MNTRVVLRTDFRNLEILYKNRNGQERDKLFINLNKLLHKSKEIIEFMGYRGKNLYAISLDIPANKAIFHDLEYSHGCDGSCGGTCFACNMSYCKTCGTWEPDLTTTCLGSKDVKLREGYNYKGGMWIEELSYTKWSEQRDLPTNGCGNNLYLLYQANKMVNYLKQLEQQYETKEDFVRSPFLLLELIDSVYIVEKLQEIVSTNNPVYSVTHEEIKEWFKYLLNTTNYFFHKQYSFGDIDAGTRNTYQRYFGKNCKLYDIAFSHKVFTPMSYIDGTVNKEIAELVKVLNDKGLETIRNKVDFSDKGARVFIKFHPELENKVIKRLYKHIVYNSKDMGEMVRAINFDSPLITIDDKVLGVYEMSFKDDKFVRNYLNNNLNIKDVKSLTSSQAISIFCKHLANIVSNY